MLDLTRSQNTTGMLKSLELATTKECSICTVGHISK